MLIREALASVVVVVGQGIVVRAPRVLNVLLGSRLVDLQFAAEDVEDVDLVAAKDLRTLGEREHPVSRPRFDTVLLLEDRVGDLLELKDGLAVDLSVLEFFEGKLFGPLLLLCCHFLLLCGLETPIEGAGPADKRVLLDKLELLLL